MKMILKGSVLALILFALVTFTYTFAGQSNTQSDEVVQVGKTNLPVAGQAVPKVDKKKITRLELDPNRTLTLFGVVRDNALGLADEILNLGKKSNAPIYLILDSPGGSVITGGILISAIQASKAPVYTICYKVCASMAAMIHQYGKERFQVDRSILMFHPATAGTEGEVDKMNSFIGFLKRYCDKFLYEIGERSGLGFQKLKDLASVELWIDAEDAVAMNLTDKIVSVSLKQVERDTEIMEPDEKKDIPNKRKLIWITDLGIDL